MILAAAKPLVLYYLLVMRFALGPDGLADFTRAPEQLFINAPHLSSQLCREFGLALVARLGGAAEQYRVACLSRRAGGPEL